MPVRIVALSFFLAASLLITGCSDTTRGALSVETGGKTDDPATGFENVRAGTEQDFIMAVGRRIYFAEDSAELDDVARETLDLQAEWLKQHVRWLVKVQGFADDSPSAVGNITLSDKRANQVMEYLASRGVNKQRLWMKGYGSERLVRDCDDIACKAQNRRVIVNLRTEFDAAAPQFRGG